MLCSQRERALASSQFKDYNPRVEHHVSKLMEVIRKADGKEVNILKIIENFVFDMYVGYLFSGLP